MGIDYSVLALQKGTPRIVSRIAYKRQREAEALARRAALPKGPTRKTLQARKKRRERSVISSVRAACVERDGYCRVESAGYGRTMVEGDQVSIAEASRCDGPSEWAHLGEKKRSRTRGQAPAVRHTTGGSLLLCRAHHRAYDAGRLRIVALDGERGADGPLSMDVAT